MLELAVLGKLQVRWHGEEVTAVLPQKGQALLAYLAVTRQQVTRSVLAGLLWGEMPEEAARANLRLTLSRLRKVVGDVIVAGRSTIAFDFDQPHWLDYALFTETAVLPSAQLQQAIALYRGDFLDDLLVSDAPEFESWVLTLREQARQQFQAMLVRLVDEAYAAGQWADGIGWARRLLALEPWDEGAHRQLMRLLAANGQRSAALAQFRVCVDLLAEELGVEPEPETVALAEAIRAGEQGSGGAGERGSKGAEEREGLGVRLPRVGSRLVGREVELGQLQQLLAQPTCRLLTLMGMGGNGKTRLALAAAETQVGVFRDGVVFVSLVGTTAVSATEAVNVLATTIANTLDYTFSAQRPLRDSLLDYLRDKKLLLLLDNFESMLAAASFLPEVLQAAPQVKLVVTSRERLNVTAEWVFDVAGLPFPGGQAAELLAYPALAFFVDRARQVRPDFDGVAEETAVYRICQLVHGSPLALELAANWVRLLSCEEIAAQLKKDLDLLQSHTNDRHPRQQSMAAVLAASWALLDDGERQAMRHLTVFHDGWSLAGAQVVAGVGLPLLARLVDKSLLEVEKNGRYRLHELVRQYGLEQLGHDPDEAAAVQHRFAEYYADFLQKRRLELGDRQVVAALDEEVENVRAAWQWVVREEKRPLLVPFLAALWEYYRRKGWYQEAVGVLTQACQLPDWSPLQQAQWRRWLGEAFYQLGDLRESGQQVEVGLALLKRPLPQRTLGWFWLATQQTFTQLWHRLYPPRAQARPEADPQQEILHALRLRAQLYYFAKQRERSAGLNLYALNLAERLGLPAETAMGYGGMTMLFRNLARHKLADRYRALAEQLLPDITLAAEKAAVLELVGYDGMSVGQWSLANQTLTEAASLFTRLEMGRSWAECWTLLGFLQLLRGHFDHAARQYAEAGQAASQRGDLFFRFVGLAGQAACLLRLGDSYLPDVAVLLEQAQAMANLQLTAEDKVLLYGLLGRLQLRLGHLVEAEAWAHETLAAMTQSTFMYFYSMDGYTAPTEIFLALTAATPRQPQREQVMREALQRQQAFARVYPVGQPGAWLAAGRWAWANGRFPQAHQLWQQSLNAAQKLGMSYETARTHWVIGQHLPVEAEERAAHLQQAERLFEQLGLAAPSDDFLP